MGNAGTGGAVRYCCSDARHNRRDAGAPAPAAGLSQAVPAVLVAQLKLFNRRSSVPPSGHLQGAQPRQRRAQYTSQQVTGHSVIASTLQALQRVAACVGSTTQALQRVAACLWQYSTSCSCCGADAAPGGDAARRAGRQRGGRMHGAHRAGEQGCMCVEGRERIEGRK